MAQNSLEGVALSKVQALAAALDDNNGPEIRQKWGGLVRMFGIKNLRPYYPSIAKLLTPEQADRLARMTPFKV